MILNLICSLRKQKGGWIMENSEIISIIIQSLIESIKKDNLIIYNHDRSLELKVIGLIKKHELESIDSLDPLIAKFLQEKIPTLFTANLLESIYFIIETELVYIVININETKISEDGQLIWEFLDGLNLEVMKAGNVIGVFQKLVETGQINIIPKTDLQAVKDNLPTEGLSLSEQAEEVLDKYLEEKKISILGAHIGNNEPQEICKGLADIRENHLFFSPIPGEYFIPIIDKYLDEEEEDDDKAQEEYIEEHVLPNMSEEDFKTYTEQRRIAKQKDAQEARCNILLHGKNYLDDLKYGINFEENLEQLMEILKTRNI